jgi:hypothetical protein
MASISLISAMDLFLPFGFWKLILLQPALVPLPGPAAALIALLKSKPSRDRGRPPVPLLSQNLIDFWFKRFLV